MGSRSVKELPVPILTDDELIDEYARTFQAAKPQSDNGSSRRPDEVTIRRNAAAMGELLRRGYRSAVPVWMKSETA